MQQLVFATRNKHKIREFQDLVAPLGLQAVSLSELAPDAPDVEETGSSFHANARLKAEAAYRLTGLPALADDSGICIDALDGAPGIFSARWAGDSGPDKDESNNDRMLRELEGVPDEKRGAHYACSLVLVCGPDFIRADAPSPATVRTDGAMEVHFQGQLFGRIGYERTGVGGFGYDPLFVVPETGKTVAQLAASEKHAISHRGKAFVALTAFIETYRGRFLL